jgi:hypothetical protein
MNKLSNTIAASALLVPVAAFATLYNIVGTDQFVNGVPSSLTVKERAKLVTTTISKTESSCLANKCELVDKAKAKAKIKAIILAESVPVCTAPSVLNPATNNCETPAPVSFMPKVDLTKNMTPAIGYNTLRVQPATDAPRIGDIRFDDDKGRMGAFRITCKPSHMSNDDPIVYPNQQGAAHHHTFFGNTNLKYNTDLTTLSTTGNSTCNGGIMNRSAYWVPSMIDTKTNTPLVPVASLWYYKSGYWVRNSDIKPPPKGLRMIAGNMKATTAAGNVGGHYACRDSTNETIAGGKSIPACAVGNTINSEVEFKQCWDGKNLDSPNHQDHMADIAQGGVCPASHPVAIPHITLQIGYKVTDAEGTKNWRLSSDNYAPSGYNAGYSTHGDFVYGWDDTFIANIVKNCIGAGMDCHAHLLGDGRMFY